jgi:hypothetical protein
MGIRQVSSDRLLRQFGIACVASGVLGVLAGILTLAYPAAVPRDRWSYPFPTGLFLVFSIGLAITHLLTLLGFVGVRRTGAARGSRLASVALALAILGLGLLALSEVFSGFIGDRSTDSSAAGLVGGLFGIASLFAAFGPIIAGAAFLRGRTWNSLGSWSILASGVILIALVTPANIVDNELFRMISLTLWSICFVLLGLVLMKGGGRPGSEP